MKSEHQSYTSWRVLGLDEGQPRPESEAGTTGPSARRDRSKAGGAPAADRETEGMGSWQWEETKREGERSCLKLKRKQGIW